jgi:hypothetical protein
LLDAFDQCVLCRWVDELETGDICDSQPTQFQDEIRQINSLDLRRQRLLHFFKPLPRINPITLASFDPARPAHPLPGTALAAGHHDHRLDCLLVVPDFDLDEAAVDDVVEVVQRDGAFGDVGGDDDFTL